MVAEMPQLRSGGDWSPSLICRDLVTAVTDLFARTERDAFHDDGSPGRFACADRTGASAPVPPSS